MGVLSLPLAPTPFPSSQFIPKPTTFQPVALFPPPPKSSLKKSEVRPYPNALAQYTLYCFLLQLPSVTWSQPPPSSLPLGGSKPSQVCGPGYLSVRRCCTLAGAGVKYRRAEISFQGGAALSPAGTGPLLGRGSAPLDGQHTVRVSWGLAPLMPIHMPVRVVIHITPDGFSLLGVTVTPPPWWSLRAPFFSSFWTAIRI